MGKHGSLEWLPGKGVGLSADVLPGPVPGRPAADLPVHRRRPRRGRGGQAAGARRDRRPSAAADDDRRDLRRPRPARAAGGRVLPARAHRPRPSCRCSRSRSGRCWREANLEGEIETLLNASTPRTTHAGTALMDDPLSLTPTSAAKTSPTSSRTSTPTCTSSAWRRSATGSTSSASRRGRAAGRLGHDAGAAAQRLGARACATASARPTASTCDGARRSPARRIATIAALAADAASPIEANADAIEAVQALVARAAARAARRAIRGRMRSTAPSPRRCPARTTPTGCAQTREALALRLRAAAARASAAPTRRSATSSTRSTGATCRPARAARRRAAWRTCCRPAATSTRSTRARSPARPPGWSASDLARGVVERYLRDEGALPGERRHLDLGHQRDAHLTATTSPRCWRCSGVRPGLAAGEPPRRRRRGDPARRARPPAHRRRLPHLRLLPRRLPARDRAAGRGVRARLALDEPLDQNFVRAHRLADAATGCARRACGEARRGGGPATASSAASPAPTARASCQLIDEQAWRDDADLAATYVNWGGYAYTREEYGMDARGAFREALAQVCGGDQEPGQPRARHLRLRRLLPVPRRHDRHDPRADRPRTRAPTSATPRTPTARRSAR